ncbi:hypothetical protein SAMN04488078_100921 [Antarctobacter heliothermus]|uniref:Uncharacterized protein n=1 Tax=Antarctobacter heliothermus TaxID=74033 RepID=A0A239D214_9RHOB|nr:hypothetical protein SAMN04488078_100921 [Antarctobacter heliothermus]
MRGGRDSDPFGAHRPPANPPANPFANPFARPVFDLVATRRVRCDLFLVDAVRGKGATLVDHVGRIAREFCL